MISSAITFGRMKRVYVISVVALTAVVVAVSISLLYPVALPSFMCYQFDLPEYEKTYGFTFSEVLSEAMPNGRTRSVFGISAVEPNGAFARSGVRVGDVPSMYHGVQDFCGDIAWAEESDRVWMRVINVYDKKAGKEAQREVLLQLRRK